MSLDLSSLVKTPTTPAPTPAREASSSKTQMVAFRLPTELVTRLKTAAWEHRETQTSLVTAALQDKLDALDSQAR